jgi:hypothetical protein
VPPLFELHPIARATAPAPAARAHHFHDRSMCLRSPYATLTTGSPRWATKCPPSGVPRGASRSEASCRPRCPPDSSRRWPCTSRCWPRSRPQ